ncbi:MAG: DNA photolyase family protein [Bacteroidota bacterium]|nr:DNA photolyase family protein [Bacteroidota bacterium]
MRIAVVWLRRDLRIQDNRALISALKSGLPVLPLFIFDNTILQELPLDDSRVSFIYKTLKNIHDKLVEKGGFLLCLKGNPLEAWEQLLSKYDIAEVFINKDYEPYALKRDETIKTFLNNKGIKLLAYKDQVIFEQSEILKNDSKPYTVFTPYKKKWLQNFENKMAHNENQIDFANLYHGTHKMPSLSDIGFQQSTLKVKEYSLSNLDNYEISRNFPAYETTHLGPHLRFGTVSIRQVISQLKPSHEVFLSELIWREFFMQILFHFPKVVNQNFKSQYNGIEWRNNEDEFKLWCKGETGYPMVDAGMRELNATGYMHNRVRMVTAGFLTKHLLIDWRWGEAYFAEKLLDYELSSNNGNWQWAAGTGCDSAPYFRIFNPQEQLKKFDKELKYIKKWVPEYGSKDYIEPIIEHKIARQRALSVYKNGLTIKKSSY